MTAKDLKSKGFVSEELIAPLKPFHEAMWEVFPDHCKAMGPCEFQPVAIYHKINSPNPCRWFLCPIPGLSLYDLVAAARIMMNDQLSAVHIPGGLMAVKPDEEVMAEAMKLTAVEIRSFIALRSLSETELLHAGDLTP